MLVTDLLKLVNTYIGDSSNDRLSMDDRYQSVSEATAWLLEELGNEHMVDRTDVEFLPTVTWYKMDGITPYLLTAGQLRFKEDQDDRIDFTRLEARDLASMAHNRHAYTIERYNGDSYLGIVMPESSQGQHRDLVDMSTKDSLTYTGVNATNIVKNEDSISFDTDALSQTSTGIRTTTSSINLTDYQGTGVLIFEVEIPDMTDINSVSLKFGESLSSDYWLGTVSQDVNGDPLTEGVNTIKIKWNDLTQVGTPDVAAVTEWEWLINHDNTQPLVEGYKLSDLRIAKPIDLTFKYIFYRVGKDTSGVDITEFTAGTDVPFFGERYPQYKFAVAHKAAGILFRSLQLPENATGEDRQAENSLSRYRKNFSGERDMNNSAFKIAGVSLRNRRIIRRR